VAVAVAVAAICTASSLLLDGPSIETMHAHCMVVLAMAQCPWMPFPRAFARR